MMKHTGKVKNLLFILDGYPYKTGRSCVFVRNMIVAMADMGINCTVIAPQIITPSNILKRGLPYHHKDITPNGNGVDVYAPRYVYYPGKLGFVKASMDNHLRAVLKTIKKERIEFDAVYGHFVFQCGLTAARLGEKLNVPSFLGAGESDKLMTGNKRCNGVYENGVKNYGWQDILNKLSGVVCVSEWTKKLLFENGFLSDKMAEKTQIFVNGVNKNLFKPGNKKAARKELSLPENDFIVAFVGAFNDNKGVLRLAQAITQAKDAKVVFLGSGELNPECPGILAEKTCSNSEVALYLQAADCFALPTKSEGCCNAIVEALSCGLPVISSDLPFNDGILDETNGIRIDPENVDELTKAITKLMENTEYLKELSDGALESSKDFGIEERAKNIYSFIQKVTDL